MANLAELRAFMSKKNITTVIVTNPAHQFYLSGFKALIYSRPIFYLADGESTHLIVPGLEELHAKEEAIVDHILVYYEHPQGASHGTDPFVHIKNLLNDNPANETIGIDLDYAPASIVGQIKDLGYDVTDIGRKIEKMRYIKDSNEIEYMRQAGSLVEIAVQKSIEACRAGITELEVDAKGNTALFEETTKRFPEASLDITVMSPSGAKRSVMPHAFSNTRKLVEGDVLIHSRQVGLNGYRAELERTVIIGDPTEQQKLAFEAATVAQEAALEMIRPGVQALEVDQAAKEVLDKEGFAKFLVHRVGHAIGVSAHEKPYLTFDNPLVLEEGMVFCIEPGIYIPGVGGFRHSDTVVITTDGCQFLTDYPRTLGHLMR